MYSAYCWRKSKKVKYHLKYSVVKYYLVKHNVVKYCVVNVCVLSTQVEERRALAGRFGAVPVDANGDVEAAIAAATEGRGVDVAMEVGWVICVWAGIMHFLRIPYVGGPMLCGKL